MDTATTPSKSEHATKRRPTDSSKSNAHGCEKMSAATEALPYGCTVHSMVTTLPVVLSECLRTRQHVSPE